MNTTTKPFIGVLLCALAMGFLLPAHAEESPDSQNDLPSAQHRHGGGIVSIGHDAALGAGQRADSVVAVLGSVTSAGEVKDQVVAVMGDGHVTGPVGNEVVVVGGDLYLDSRVGGQVSVVLGNLTLGPQADIEGDVNVVGGTIDRDTQSRIAGATNRVTKSRVFDAGWIRTWFRECLLYGRPLALVPGLGWAWGIAIGFLAFYCLLALTLQDAFGRCVQTLESRPGRSALASLLTIVLTPVLFVLICLTIIGILLLPFLALALFCLGLFGKAVVLATIGRRFTRQLGERAFAQHALAVLLGGILVLALYLVPVVGIIVYKLLGILGLGVVLYTLLLVAEAHHDGKTAPAPLITESYAPSASEQPAAVASASPAATAALPRAGFWIRIGALMLDALLVAVILSILHPFNHLFVLVLAIYGALMWKLRGATIGGIICHLQVVRTDGRAIEWETVVVRALGCFLSAIPLGLGFIWMVFDDNAQTWHDKLAGTVVVRTPKR